MALSSAQYTLGSATPTQIVPPSVMPQWVTVHNMTKSSNEYVFLGGPTVGTANGIHVDPGDTVQLKMLPLESLWAVSDPNGLVVAVLISRQD